MDNNFKDLGPQFFVEILEGENYGDFIAKPGRLLGYIEFLLNEIHGKIKNSGTLSFMINSDTYDCKYLECEKSTKSFFCFVSSNKYADIYVFVFDQKNKKHYIVRDVFQLANAIEQFT